MDQNVLFCPYRTSVNWANVQTTHFSEVVTFKGEVQVTKLTAPLTFTGTPSDVELLESCKLDPSTGKYSHHNPKQS